jgi:hypothetical protein
MQPRNPFGLVETRDFHSFLATSGPVMRASSGKVDAMVAATAITEAEQAEAADRVASVLIVTSDLPHLTKLVAARTGVAVVHVSELGNAS